MTRTEKYQLSQWEASDRILREDFNADNANLESSLAALQTALDQEISDRKSAVSSASTAAANNLAAAKTQLSNSISAAKTELEGDLTDHVAAMPFVKLKDITVTTAAVQVNVDMSDVKLTDYAFIMVVPRINCGETTVELLVNNSTSYYYHANSWSENLCSFSPVSENCSCTIRISGLDGRIRCMSEKLYNSGEGTLSPSGITYNTAVTVDNFAQLNFVTVDRSTKIEAGSKITIYGLRL